MNVGRTFIGTMAGIAVGSVVLLSQPAQAGLIGAGDTVTATYFYSSHTSADAQPLNSVALGTTDPAPLVPGGVDFMQNASDFATIRVGDTSIIVTNLLSGQFCTVQTQPCPDSFNGFEFRFTGAVNITGVTVDTMASAPDFQPIPSDVTSSATDITVNLAGLPHVAANDQLVLGLTFQQTQPPPEPGPASLLLRGTALLGVAVTRHGRVRRPGAQSLGEGGEPA